MFASCHRFGGNYSFLPHTLTWIAVVCGIVVCVFLAWSVFFLLHLLYRLHIISAMLRLKKVDIDVVIGLHVACATYNWFITFTYIFTCEKLQASDEYLDVSEFLATSPAPWMPRNFLQNAQRSKSFFPFYRFCNMWNMCGVSWLLLFLFLFILVAICLSWMRHAINLA